MIENTGKETTEEQAPEVCEEEVASVTDIVLSVLKASKAFKMYLPNNTHRHKALEELKITMVSHMAKYGEIKLDVNQFELNYKGKCVYENNESKESLATRMHCDGIKSLVFTEGIEEREITELLEIIGTKPALDTDEDIITLLWIKELPHITCILAEDYTELYAGESMASSRVSQQENITSLCRSLPSVSQPVPTPIIPPHQINYLTDDELAVLKKDKDSEETNSALIEVIEVLNAIQSVEKDADVFGDFVDIMVKLSGNLIHSGDINDALALTRILKGLPNNMNFSPDHENKYVKALGGTISADIIKDLEGLIDITDKIKGEDLQDILLLFCKNNMKQICELLGIVKHVATRQVLIDTLVELGKDSLEVFYPYLRAERWQLVRDVIVILRRINTTASLRWVCKLMSHKEPKIRKEVLLSVKAFSDTEEAKIALLKFLQDDLGELRIQAVKILAELRHQDAIEPIMAIVSSEQFDKKDMDEKKAFFEALGLLGADEALPLFKDVLLRSYWFNRAKERDSVAMALSGLRKVRTDAALKMLKEVRTKKNNEMKAIIDQAVRGMETVSARI